jgi:hypothetical protein
VQYEGQDKTMGSNDSSSFTDKAVFIAIPLLPVDADEIEQELEDDFVLEVEQGNICLYTISLFVGGALGALVVFSSYISLASSSPAFSKQYDPTLDIFGVAVCYSVGILVAYVIFSIMVTKCPWTVVSSVTHKQGCLQFHSVFSGACLVLGSSLVYLLVLIGGVDDIDVILTSASCLFTLFVLVCLFPSSLDRRSAKGTILPMVVV